MDEAWGERVFESIDLFGYLWEFSQPIEGAQSADGLTPFGRAGSASNPQPPG
jgi:hypothetical protein